jgi:hypothetical protein
MVPSGQLVGTAVTQPPVGPAVKPGAQPSGGAPAA